MSGRRVKLVLGPWVRENKKWAQGWSSKCGRYFVWRNGGVPVSVGGDGPEWSSDFDGKTFSNLDPSRSEAMDSCEEHAAGRAALKETTHAENET